MLNGTELQETTKPNAKSSAISWSAFLAGSVLYLIATGTLFILVGHKTNFQQFYLLDDTYIHLAVAKNLLHTGTFGVTPHVFSAISSSVIWPFLVTAFFAVSGIHAITPLLMEIALSLLLLYLADRLLSTMEPGASLIIRLGLQAALIFSASLLVLTFGGMEHVLQIVADLLFLVTAGHALARQPVTAARLSLLAALTTAARYEGLFLVFAACVCLLWKRDVIRSIAAGLSALVPVVGIGLFSLAHGSHFLPNSLLIKAANPDQIHWRIALFSPPLQGILGRYAWHHGVAEIFLACCGLLLYAWLRPDSLSPRLRWMLIVYVATALLHSQFSRLGWIYRYEAYLLALGTFLLFCALHELASVRPRVPLTIVAIAACVLALVCLLPRTWVVTTHIPHHAEAIYEQQFQMAKFLARYYPTTPIAANDIGAISFFGDHDILDLAGLGTVQVTNLIAHHAFTTAAIDQLAHEHQTQIAVAYPSWFLGASQLPPTWIPVRSWDFDPSRSDAVGGLKVVFYTVQPQQVAALEANLEAFTPQLPHTVTQHMLR